MTFEIEPHEARDLLRRGWSMLDCWAPQLNAAIQDALADEPNEEDEETPTCEQLEALGQKRLPL